MISSFAVSLVLLVMARSGSPVSTHVALLITVAVTSVSWIITAFVGPETDRAVLVEFYRRVRPAGPGWTAIRATAGLGEDTDRTAGDNIPLALLGWAAGCMMIWSALFTVGNFLYGRWSYAWMLLAVFAITGTMVIWVMRQLWPRRTA